MLEFTKHDAQKLISWAKIIANSDFKWSVPDAKLFYKLKLLEKEIYQKAYLRSNKKMKKRTNEEFPPIIQDDDYRVVEMMEKHGGSFVKALSGAFYRADQFNFDKLKKAFPEYWEEYRGMAKK